MMVEISPAQVLRIQRAMAEEFSFRLVKINGEAAVRVFSPKSGNEYTVRAAGGCDCKDAEFHPETACKHAVACSLWIQRNPLEEMAREERMAATRARREIDFPESN